MASFWRDKARPALLEGRFDRWGATASTLCAIHCAMVPFLLLASPMLAGSLFFDHRIERVFVCVAALFGLFVLGQGFRLHQHRMPLLVLVVGVVLAVTGAFTDIHENLFWHAVFLVSGGGLIATAHWLNQRRLACCDMDLVLAE